MNALHLTWGHWVAVGVVAAEIALVGLVAWAAQWRARSGDWKRLVWQTAILGILVLVLAQAGGLVQFLGERMALADEAGGMIGFYY